MYSIDSTIEVIPNESAAESAQCVHDEFLKSLPMTGMGVNVSESRQLVVDNAGRPSFMQAVDGCGVRLKVVDTAESATPEEINVDNVRM